MSHQSPESQGLHKRVPTSKSKDADHRAEPDVEEESVMRSLLPCVFTIAGLSLLLWLLGYFLIPSRPHVTANPSSPKGNTKCTPIRDVKDLLLELREVQDWMLLGEALRIRQSLLDQWKGEITEPELRLRAVLREWYTGDVNHCWESVWSALQAIGHERLAESIAVKYRTNHLHA